MADKRESNGRSNLPSIIRIDPTTVTQHKETVLTVYGENFLGSSLVFIDANVAATTFVSTTCIEARLTAAMTASIGRKAVKVHDFETGDISNELYLEVEPSEL